MSAGLVGNRPGRAAGSVVAVLLLGLALAGCEFEFSVGDAPDEELAITDAVAALGVDEEGRPDGATSEFEVDTPEVFVVAVVRGAPDDATATATWVHDPDVVFAETTIDLEPGGSLPNFSFTRPDEGWPEGAYTVDLVVDAPDVEAVSEQVTFTVAAPAVEEDEADEIADEAEDLAGEAEEVEPPDDAVDEEPVSDITRPDGYPDDLPLPNVDGFITPVPGEEGLFATQLVAERDDVIAFLDDELPATGWTIHFQEEGIDDADAHGYFTSKDGRELLLVVEPDPEVEGWTLLSVAVDPDL